MDFDNQKVYGDTSIFDGLVSLVLDHIWYFLYSTAHLSWLRIQIKGNGTSDVSNYSVLWRMAAGDYKDY